MGRSTQHTGGSSKGEARGPRRHCPICGKPAAAEFHPFCSKRCADIDLHHWLAGTYRVPGCGDDAEGDSDSAKRHEGGDSVPENRPSDRRRN
ncbi:MAG: DNA gyrase inhibitor YacG [Methylocapsa sp.]|nr:DNA gyrase inhibitor YacG [Methylocapsa sp.]